MGILSWTSTPPQKLDPLTDPASFGNIALELSYITEQDLRDALERQEKRLPLGEILVQMGKLTEYQRDEILFEQQKRLAHNCDEVATIELKKQSRMIQYFKQNIAEIAVATHSVIAVLDQLPKGHK